MGVVGEAGGDLEERTVGDGVLHRIPGLIREDLPVQPTTAILIIPALDLCVEDALGKRKPGEFTRNILELPFGGAHGGKAPEGLVIVPLQRIRYGLPDRDDMLAR